jgi:hypothetical protein
MKVKFIFLALLLLSFIQCRSRNTTITTKEGQALTYHTFIHSDGTSWLHAQWDIAQHEKYIIKWR